MKVKLDENLPTACAEILRRGGHDVDTVADERLAGADDATVSAAASAAGRLVLTLDRGFGDARLYPPGTHAGILVLRTADQAAPAVVDTVRQLLRSVDLEDLATCIAVNRDGNLRIRRT